MDSTPWFVGGGAQHSPEVARAVAYAATGGAEGVVEPGGLKVAPLAVPGTSVRVVAGSGILRNRYAGGGEQSYIVRAPVTENLAVTATGSAGGRSDLVVARVLDPQYEGSAPSNPVAFEYARLAIIQGVPASTTRASDLNLGYPAIELARIDLPASTGTVTAAMIKDLRRLARPRSLRVVEMGGPTQDIALTSPGGVRWPSVAPSIEIPAWATHMSVVATIASVGYQNGSVAGTLATCAGAAGANQWRSSNTYYDLDVAPADSARTTLVVGGKGPIPAALRGSVQTFAIEGQRNAYTGAGALVTRAGTHVVFDVQFSEQIL